jgi:cell division protein FtsW (lipid II flippase)
MHASLRHAASCPHARYQSVTSINKNVKATPTLRVTPGLMGLVGAGLLLTSWAFVAPTEEGPTRFDLSNAPAIWVTSIATMIAAYGSVQYWLRNPMTSRPPFTLWWAVLVLAIKLVLERLYSYPVSVRIVGSALVWQTIIALVWFSAYARIQREDLPFSVEFPLELCVLAILIGLFQPSEIAALTTAVWLATYCTALGASTRMAAAGSTSLALLITLSSPWRRDRLVRYFDQTCMSGCWDLERVRAVFATADWFAPTFSEVDAMPGPPGAYLEFALTHVIRQYGLLLAIMIAAWSAALVIVPLLRLRFAADSSARAIASSSGVMLAVAWAGNVAACFGVLAWHPGWPLPFFSASMAWAMVGGVYLAAARLAVSDRGANNVATHRHQPSHLIDKEKSK